MTLTEFLLARIAEDEALAAMADGSRMRGAVHSSLNCYSEDVLYLHRWDPDRVLAWLRTQRRLLDIHKELPSEYGVGCEECAGFAYPCSTVAALALPYADHPDYDEAWRPDEDRPPMEPKTAGLLYTRPFPPGFDTSLL